MQLIEQQFEICQVPEKFSSWKESFQWTDEFLGICISIILLYKLWVEVNIKHSGQPVQPQESPQSESSNFPLFVVDCTRGVAEGFPRFIAHNYLPPSQVHLLVNLTVSF